MGGITDKLFGNNIPDEVKNPRLSAFSAPGADTGFTDQGALHFKRNTGVESLLGGVAGAFRNQAGELGALQPLVEPGFGRLTEAGIRAVRDARRSSIGDLRQNLARRRVGGSSFAADDIARTNAEFAKKENEFASQAFTQELALSNELINQKAQASANEFLQNLQQTNIETSLAAQISNGVTGILSNNAGIMAGMSNSGANRMLNVGGTAVGAYAALSNPFAAAGTPAGSPPVSGAYGMGG